MTLKKWILTTVFICSLLNAAVLSQTATAGSTQENRILIPVTVVAQNSILVTALPQESFSISVNKAPQQILSFSKPDQAASIALLFDLSGSIFGRLGDKYSVLKEALAYFIQCSHPSNEYALYTFDRRVTQEMNWSQDRTQLFSRVDGIDIKKSIGRTVFYDACVEALQSLKLRNTQRRVVFILSDAADNESKHRLEQVKRLSYETQTAIYFVNVGILRLNGMMNNDAGGTLDLQSQGVSEELAKDSGGVTLFPRGRNELFDSIQRVAKYIRCTYLIGINPSELKKESKQNKLQIKVAVPPTAPPEIKDLTVLHPQFYITSNK